MKKIALALLVIIAIVALPSCTKTAGCTLEQAVVQGVAPVVAQQLQCSNPSAIAADLTTLIGKVGLCKPDPSPSPLQLKATLGLVSPELCSFFGGLVVDTLASTAIPATWGCTADNAKGKLKDVITTACANIK